MEPYCDYVDINLGYHLFIDHLCPKFPECLYLLLSGATVYTKLGVYILVVVYIFLYVFNHLDQSLLAGPLVGLII